MSHNFIKKFKKLLKILLALALTAGAIYLAAKQCPNSARVSVITLAVLLDLALIYQK